MQNAFTYIDNATISNDTISYYSFSDHSWRQTPRHGVDWTISIVEAAMEGKFELVGEEPLHIVCKIHKHNLLALSFQPFPVI